MQVACTLTVEEGWKTTTKKRTKIKAKKKNKFPDVRDWDDIDAISNEEIKLADALFESEKFEGGMQHLSNTSNSGGSSSACTSTSPKRPSTYYLSIRK